jgi:gamma-glutamyl hercynylcysteine S-oxide synthase
MFRQNVFIKVVFCIWGIVVAPMPARLQERINKIELDQKNRIVSVMSDQGPIVLSNPIPLLSFELNKKWYPVNEPAPNLAIKIQFADTANSFIKATVSFINRSADTIVLRNVLPLQKEGSEAYITGLGEHSLSRTHLFLPSKLPVNVIVPDNAWDLGYNGFPIAINQKLILLSRRDRGSIRQGESKRFETILYPGGSIDYFLYAELYSGKWQEGLALVFQQRWLYDLPVFNDSLYRRKDIQWVRHSYVLHLMDAWDKFYYDNSDGKYHLQEFLARGKKLYGGDDVVSIWPTWPTLGLDQRNQFDLFHDLPGGITAMRNQAVMSRAKGTKFFICYNPWDESTHNKNNFEGIAELIAETTADGVVLDTKGESSKELQQAADKVRPGVVMYSEGMAVPRDMPNIVSGRVHNALYYPPMLNLNKLIKPGFAIYRVAELYKEKIKREFATSFFNGYGTEINIMAPGQPQWVNEQYKYLGRTSRILRENTFNFVNRGYTPLVPVTADSIWVNQWEYGDKTIYTIFSTIPSGYKGNLFAVEPAAGYHFADIWHHRLLVPESEHGRWLIEVQADAFNASDLGTNNEGEVDCIVKLPVLINARIDGDELFIQSKDKGNEIRIWAGAPSYEKQAVVIKPGRHTMRISKYFDRYEGDFVIQLMDRGILLDETIVTIEPGTARRISIDNPTSRVSVAPNGMALISAGTFKFRTTHGDEFIAYPKQDMDSTFSMPSFFIDKYPVTNAQFKKFLAASRYHPTDKANFLKHWVNGNIPAGWDNFPVVYISYEDAKAYAVWAGKRLPAEREWQYAAQTTSLQEWPWNQVAPVTRKEEVVNNTLTIAKLEGIDSILCNPGNGKPYAVGAYPRGVNLNGLYDLVGCVWQLTNDLYMSGSHKYIMMKGGSYFKPSSSWWYVQGGPRELHYRQFLLRVSQGFERNATVGFRCVKDTKE